MEYYKNKLEKKPSTTKLEMSAAGMDLERREFQNFQPVPDNIVS